MNTESLKLLNGQIVTDL